MRALGDGDQVSEKGVPGRGQHVRLQQCSAVQGSVLACLPAHVADGEYYEYTRACRKKVTIPPVIASRDVKRHVKISSDSRDLRQDHRSV